MLKKLGMIGLIAAGSFASDVAAEGKQTREIAIKRMADFSAYVQEHGFSRALDTLNGMGAGDVSGTGQASKEREMSSKFTDNKNPIRCVMDGVEVTTNHIGDAPSNKDMINALKQSSTKGEAHIFNVTKTGEMYDPASGKNIKKQDWSAFYVMGRESLGAKKGSKLSKLMCYTAYEVD